MLQIFPVRIKMKKLFNSWFKWCNRESLIIFLVCFAFGMEGWHGTVGIPGCCWSGFQMGVLRLNLGYKKFGDNIYEGREGEEVGVGRGARLTVEAGPGEPQLTQQSSARSLAQAVSRVRPKWLDLCIHAWLDSRQGLLLPGPDLGHRALCSWDQVRELHTANPSWRALWEQVCVCY